MARQKHYDDGQIKLVPVDFEQQILPRASNTRSSSCQALTYTKRRRASGRLSQPRRPS
jgi:hypothetical protein